MYACSKEEEVRLRESHSQRVVELGSWDSRPCFPHLPQKGLFLWTALYSFIYQGRVQNAV